MFRHPSPKRLGDGVFLSSLLKRYAEGLAEKPIKAGAFSRSHMIRKVRGTAPFHPNCTHNVQHLNSTRGMVQPKFEQRATRDPQSKQSIKAIHIAEQDTLYTKSILHDLSNKIANIVHRFRFKLLFANSRAKIIVISTVL